MSSSLRVEDDTPSTLGGLRAPRIRTLTDDGGTQFDGEELQHLLLRAIDSTNTASVRQILDDITNTEAELREAIMCTPSARTEHTLRTPLMSAAASGNIEIYGAVIVAFDSNFLKADGTFRVSDRGVEMARQLDVVDGEDMTLLMHAAASGVSAIFKAVAEEVTAPKSRRVLRARDERRMTVLMHAANAKSDRRPVASTATANDTGPNRRSLGEDGAPRDASGDPSRDPSRDPSSIHPPSPAQEAPAPPQPADGEETGRNPESAAARSAPQSDPVAMPLDPWVPLIVTVFEFAREQLWLADYRQLLGARDAWHRSVLEHAIVSGRAQVFEAVFAAVREDIHDEKIANMLDTGMESSYTNNAISIALAAVEGTNVPPLVAEKTKSLQRDVALRAEASTVAAKIQTFIPGNIIVIFQLLLPELREDSDGPLYLLLGLCIVSPLWSWGADRTVSRDAESQNSAPRPATLFWGIGTSKIGSNSFGWAETMSAAALAVATIVLPALDSFFSGRGGRDALGAVTLAFLNLWDWCKSCACSKKSVIVPERSAADDVMNGAQRQQALRDHTHTYLQASPSVQDASPRARDSLNRRENAPAATDVMEAGGPSPVGEQRPIAIPHIDSARSHGSQARIWQT